MHHAPVPRTLPVHAERLPEHRDGSGLSRRGNISPYRRRTAASLIRELGRRPHHRIPPPPPPGRFTAAEPLVAIRLGELL